MATSPDDPRAAIAPGPSRPDDLPEAEFQRLAGAWLAPPPDEVAVLLADVPFDWWLVGGWALEVEGVPPREHKDTDVGFPLHDLPALRRWAKDTGLDVWAPLPHGYRPVLPGGLVHPDEEQFWVRRDATSPWLLDLLATPVEGGDWVFKKDHRIRMPMDRAVVRRGGPAHLATELVLLHLAARPDPADRPPTDLPLDGPSRAWLVEALGTFRPEHPWIAVLEAG